MYHKSSWVWCPMWNRHGWKFQPAHEKWTWHNIVSKCWWGFFAGNFEVAIFLKLSMLCWKARLHGIRRTLDPFISDSVFQQQKKGCPWRSLTNRPVSVWPPCFVNENTSNRKGKKRKRIVWLFNFLLKCVFIVVLYLVFGIFPSLGTFLESVHLFWNLEGSWDLQKISL